MIRYYIGSIWYNINLLINAQTILRSHRLFTSFAKAFFKVDVIIWALMYLYFMNKVIWFVIGNWLYFPMAFFNGLFLANLCAYFFLKANGFKYDCNRQ